MNKELFDNWASTYNESILKSERDETYPFYGYGKIQKHIFKEANLKQNSKILEMGIGTGMMTKKLYDLDHDITGVDFSSKMINEAKKVMPFNRYIESGFIKVLDIIQDDKFDMIIFSYSIHHLTPINQKYILDVLSNNLTENGKIIIGDVITRTKKNMETLARVNARIWDDEEHYPTYEEYNNQVLNQHYNLEFKEVTFCSGIISLIKRANTK